MVRALKFSLRRLKGTVGEYRSHRRWDTVPNAVTMAGILGVILYTYLFLTERAVWLIPMLHASIVVSDGLDGWLADKLDQHSLVGKYLDPMRDRLHAAALFLNFFLFSSSGGVQIALIVAAVSEIWITTMGLTGRVRNAHMVGKIRAVVYAVCGLVGLIQLYWNNDATDSLLATLAGIMAAASVGAAVFYTYQAYARPKERSE